MHLEAAALCVNLCTKNNSYVIPVRIHEVLSETSDI